MTNNNKLAEVTERIEELAGHFFCGGVTQPDAAELAVKMLDGIKNDTQWNQLEILMGGLDSLIGQFLQCEQMEQMNANTDVQDMLKPGGRMISLTGNVWVKPMKPKGNKQRKRRSR